MEPDALTKGQRLADLDARTRLEDLKNLCRLRERFVRTGDGRIRTRSRDTDTSHDGCGLPQLVNIAGYDDENLAKAPEAQNEVE